MIFLFVCSFLLHLIVCANSLSKECNPIECFQVFDTLFQPSNMETSCEKITNLEECIKVCTRNETDDFFHQGLAELREELCQYGRNQLENKCGNKHKFSLAACIYDKFNYEAEDPNANQNTLLCKQAQDGENCYVNSLPMCSDRSGYLTSLLLVNLFNPVRRINCINFKQEDFDLPVKSVPFVKDLQSLAECLDLNSPHLTLCVRKKRTITNSMLDGGNICSDAHYFYDCAQRVLQSKCSIAQRAFFKSIREPLFSYLLPHCSDVALPIKSPPNAMDTQSYHEDTPEVSVLDQVTSVSPTNATRVHGSSKVDSDASTNGATSPTHSPSASGVHGLSKDNSDVITNGAISSTHSPSASGVHGLNKDNSDVATNAAVSPTNATEVRVLHQHVVITMTYREKNAASQVCFCFYLFILVFLLELGKKFT